MQDRFPEYHRASMPCSNAPRAADSGSPHNGSNPASAQQAPYNGQNGSVHWPSEADLQASSVSYTPSDGSLQASSEFQAVYGNGASGTGTNSCSAYAPCPYSGSYPGTPSFSTATSFASMDPDEEVLIVQEVTEEEVGC